MLGWSTRDQRAYTNLALDFSPIHQNSDYLQYIFYKKNVLRNILF